MESRGRSYLSPLAGVDRDLAIAIAPELTEAVDEVIEAIRAAVPEYAQPLEGAFGRAVRTGVEEALTRFVDAVAGSAEGESERWRRVYLGLGRGEARAGRTMESLLAAYRVGARVAWRRVADAAAGAGASQPELTALAEAIFAYIDELSAISAEGYAAEQAAAAGEFQRRRERLLRTLIEGHVGRSEIEEEAAGVGWPVPPVAAALLVREERIASVAARLGAGSLVASLSEGLLCAIVPDPEAPGRASELRRAVRERPAAIGPALELERFGRSLALARLALALHERGTIAGESPARVTAHLPALIVHQDEALLAEHAARTLEPLSGVPRRSRERLLETIAAWVEHPGRPTEVARRLHIHPQTARYRLRRLRELFGDIDDPARRFAFALALRAPQDEPP
jgi:PucR C-terminal helix-turn-helix domain